MFNTNDYNVSHSEIDNHSPCYSADDEEDLFQIDDLPTTINNPPPQNATEIDMQVRYYKPTNEPPHGLSQSVVTNDTDYLRKNIMNMRTKSMMAINNQLSPSYLETLFESEEIDNKSNNSCQEEKLKDYDSYLIPSIISNKKNQRTTIYSQSVPLYSSFLSKFHRIKQHAKSEDDESESSLKNDFISTPKEESEESSIIIADDQIETKKPDEPIKTKQQQDVVSSQSDSRQNMGTHSQLSSSTPLENAKSEITATTKQYQDVVSIQSNSKDEPTKTVQQQAIVSNQSNSKQNMATHSQLLSSAPLEQAEPEITITEQQNLLVPTPSHNNYTRNNRNKYDESSFDSWGILASKRYKEDNKIYFQRRQWLFNQPDDSTLNKKSQRWENIHLEPNAYEKVATNPFIYQCILQNCCSVKVTGISEFARYKDIEDFFFSPHVVYVRYIRALQCAHIMYRNYDEMAKAISIHDRTELRGSMIYCRQSSYQELDKDNNINTNTIYTKYKTKKKRPIPKDIIGRQRDTFIPEHHGIIQKSKYSVSSKKEQQHQNKTNNASPPFHETTYSNRQHNYLLNYVIPIDPMHYMYSYYQYVILKPWTEQDVEFSQMSYYWSFNQKNVASMNRLFRITPYVVLIFSITGSKSYQGYAIMKSEIMDLASLNDQELAGTPFYQSDGKFKTIQGGRQWRHVCKIEWIDIKRIDMYPTGNIQNPWCRYMPIRYSKDCTIIEPDVGNRIIEEFCYYQ